jgi:sugar/nucleoside kinase (ribokinase family)
MNPPKPKVVIASKVITDIYFPENLRPGGKYDSIGQKRGGAVLTTVPILQSLGIDTAVCGRWAEGDEPSQEHLEAVGAEWRMVRVEGRGIMNAVIEKDGEPVILRLARGPQRWELTTEEGEFLSHCRADAFAAGGSMDRGYAAALIDVAAARGIPFYWNAGGNADLSQAGIGNVILQVSHAEFGDSDTPPEDLARKLLATTGATGVIVTDSVRGAAASLRSDARVLHVPALRVPPDQEVHRVGAGDAFFGGFVSVMVMAPASPGRFQKALHNARVAAAAYVTGMTIGGWRDLSLFERQVYDPNVAAIRPAA